jgi:hypothetical protein
MWSMSQPVQRCQVEPARALGKVTAFDLLKAVQLFARTLMEEPLSGRQPGHLLHHQFPEH